MTFTEAALAVLEQAGRPLQVRQIADMAVERGLLSHVGKTPVQTMSARISAAITREGEECPFVRVRPGVFALAKWNDHPPRASRPAEAAARPQPQRSETKSTPGRRSGRSRRGTEPDGTAPPTLKPEPAQQPSRRGAESGATQPSTPRSKSSPQPKSTPRSKSSPQPKPRPPVEREADVESRSRQRSEAAAPRDERPVENRAAPEDPRTQRRRAKKVRRSLESAPTAESTETGTARGEVVDRVIEYLGAGKGAVKGAVLSTRLGFKGRGAAGALDAVLAADELERQLTGHTARLARAGQSWKLAVRDENGEAAELIEQIEQQVANTVAIAAGQVRDRLANLTLGQLGQIVLVYLGRRGFARPAPVGHQTDRSMHWSVRDPYGGTRAVVLVHDLKLQTLNETFIIRLRGALHHYSAAGGIILTTGDFDESALREAQVINLPPIELIGGEKLSRELVRQGLGVRQQQVEIPICDGSFFDELF